MADFMSTFLAACLAVIVILAIAILLLFVAHRSSRRKKMPWVRFQAKIRGIERNLERLSTRQDSLSRRQWHQERMLVEIRESTRAAETPSFKTDNFQVQEDTEFSALFITSNGGGIGHLTRMTSLARAWSGRSHILTLASGHNPFGKLGIPLTYFPSKIEHLSRRLWGQAFLYVVREVTIESEADVLVFDGTFVYPELVQVSRELDVPLIWVQRGFWRDNLPREQLRQRELTDLFCDGVIVPGDYAGSDGFEHSKAVDVIEVPPITLTNSATMYSRDDALATLELSPERKHALIQLGAGNINETAPLIQAAVEHIAQLGDEWVPVIMRHPGADDAQSLRNLGVEVRSFFPIADLYSAFEFVIVAGGYNSVQEVVTTKTPAIVVPNDRTLVDDQCRRADQLVEAGLALVARTPDQLANAIEEIATSVTMQRLRRELASVVTSDGAKAAVEAIAEVADARRRAIRMSSRSEEA